MHRRAPVAIAAIGCVAGLSAAACSSLLGADFGDVVKREAPDFVGVDAGGVGPTSDGGNPPSLDGALADVAPGDAASCGPGQKSCAGKCVSTLDPQYGCQATTCSPCNLAFATAACGAGLCAIAACNPGHDDCDGRADNGCETDLSSSHDHCGACGNACGATQVCTSGACASACNNGLVDCGGSCVNTASDPSHCGGCAPCPAVANGQPTCGNGVCGVSCQPGANNCGGACQVESPSYCGASCAFCDGPPSGQGTATCTKGVCGVSCDPGYNYCTAFADCIQNSPTSCGPTCDQCNAPANGTATCSAAGVCDFTCPTGFTKSGGACVPVGVDSGGSTTYGYSAALTAAPVSAVTGYFYGYDITVSQSGALVSFGLLGPSGSGQVGNVTLALYADSAGAPGALIAQTASTPLAATMSIPPTAPASVVAGTYWILGEYDSTPSINTGANSSQMDSYFTMASYGAAPTTAGAATSYSGVEFNYFIVVH